MVLQFVGFDPSMDQPLKSLPPGANVFGILPGTLWGTSRDRVVIIGAHWDTMDNTGGYDDNGSGVAAVLELARQIVESHCRPKNTIIFATFDLEEMGGQVLISFRDLHIPLVESSRANMVFQNYSKSVVN